MTIDAIVLIGSLIGVGEFSFANYIGSIPYITCYNGKRRADSSQQLLFDGVADGCASTREHNFCS